MYAIVYAPFDFFFRIAKVVWSIEEIREEKNQAAKVVEWQCLWSNLFQPKRHELNDTRRCLASITRQRKSNYIGSMEISCTREKCNGLLG